MKLGNENVNAALAGMQWYFVVNLFQKLVTFSLNQCLINWTNPEIFGVAAVQLELLLSTLLFLSREGIRLTSLRSVVNSEETFQQLINLSWVPSFFIFLVTASIAVFAHMGYDVGVGSIDTTTMLLYCCGAFLEAIGEPWLNTYQNGLQLGPRMRADTAAVLVRSVATIYCVALRNMGVRGFGVAQMAFGFTHVLMLVGSMPYAPVQGRVRQLQHFLPRLITETSEPPGDQLVSSNRKKFIDMSMLGVACSTTGTSILKHLLTEADKIVLSVGSSNYSQGVFAVANNYGSLVARLIYLPVEDSCRIAFAKSSGEIQQLCDECSPLVSKVPIPPSKPTDASSISNETSGKSIISSPTSSFATIRAKLDSQSQLLTRLLRTTGVFGSLFPLFGLPYTSAVVQIIFSSKWRHIETVKTLSAFCVYLFVLGLNGVSEAFVQAAFPPKAFIRLNFNLILSTMVYVVAAVPLVRYWGTSGVVVASTLSMTVRMASNMVYIHQYFTKPFLFLNIAEDDWKKQVAVAIKSPVDQLFGGSMNLRAIASFSIALSVALLFMWASTNRFNMAVELSGGSASLSSLGQHVSIGAASFLLCAVVSWWLTPREELLRTVKLLRGRID